jgi:phage antirepressor YoqD-like protein
MLHALTAGSMPATAAQTMSSREIAELTGKEHKNVLADVRKMLDELGKTSAEFSANLPDAYGRPQQVFNLPKDLTITLVSGYNVQMRHRIVTRWMELESAQVSPAPFKIPSSLSEALRLAAELEEKRSEAVAALEAAKPMVEALGRIAEGEGAMCVTNAAKVLQVQPKALFSWLSQNQWIYRRPGGAGWVSYQSRIQSGHLEHKVTSLERSDRPDKVVEQVMVTPKGLAFLAEVVPHGKSPASGRAVKAPNATSPQHAPGFC